MTDVLMIQTSDGATIEYVNGVATMSDGLTNAAYLSMFGGNDDDSGLDGDTRTWWGNVTETDVSRQYRSETRYLLRTIPAIPANLKRVQEAAERDLAWMLSTKLASSVSARVTMPALNRVRLEVSIVVADQQFAAAFVEDWRASA